MRPPALPFRPAAEWTICPDGRLALAFPDPYRIALVGRAGSPIVGAPVGYQPVPVTEGHKEAWRAEVAVLQPTLMYCRGSRESSYQLQRWPVREPEEWSHTLPPFLLGALRCDLDGRLWVLRTGEAVAPPVYDVFDHAGRRTHQIEIPRGGSNHGLRAPTSLPGHPGRVRLGVCRAPPPPDLTTSSGSGPIGVVASKRNLARADCDAPLEERPCRYHAAPAAAASPVAQAPAVAAR